MTLRKNAITVRYPMYNHNKIKQIYDMAKISSNNDYRAYKRELLPYILG
jgi:hypothetical protein